MAEATLFVPVRRPGPSSHADMRRPGSGNGSGNNETIAEFAGAVPYKDPAEFDRIRNALRIAGLPE